MGILSFLWKKRKTNNMTPSDNEGENLSLKNLPTNILQEIITCLPFDSILNCKLVCRSWRNLVSTHHLSLSQSHLTRLHDFGKLSFLFKTKNRLRYFEYNEIHDETPEYSIRWLNINPPFKSYFEVLGSFNGLVCLLGWRDLAYCICNPLTREYVMLPKFNSENHRNFGEFWIGFGYVPSTNEYKVVELYKLRGEVNVIQAAVYTLGSGEGWRNVGRFDTKSPCINMFGVFANGAVHWADAERKWVLAFDLNEEKFREHITLPPFPADVKSYGYTLGELSGVLYCFPNTVGLCSDIWLLKEKNDDSDMKEQVEHKPLGWRKEFSLTAGRKPLAFTKSGGVLFHNFQSLDIYNPIVSTFEKLVDCNAVDRIIPHLNTFVSLKELGEEDIKIMELAEIIETEESSDLKKKQVEK